jgi:protein TonB
MNRTPAAPTPPVATAPPAVEPAPAAPAPTGPTAEDLQKQIAELAANQADISKYADEIKKLQKQLEDARRPPAERPAAPSKPAETTTAATTPPPATSTSPAATPNQPTTAASTGSTPATTPATSQPTAPAAPTDPAPEPVATDPAPQPAPAAAPTRFGDLVRRGPGVVVPKLLRNPQPAYPEIARRTNRTATVVVSVLVDENGRVSETKIQNKVGMGFDEAASRAAKGAVYQPAQKDGVRVKMWWELAVNFKP